MKRILIALLPVLMLAFMLTSCGLFVERPEITEGRFNFSVTYLINGEEKTVSGVYVCEYAGASWTIDGGSFSRGWDGYAEGTEGDEAREAHRVKIGSTGDGGDIFITFGFSADYFMGDHAMGEDYSPVPEVYVEYSNETDDMATSFSDAAMIEELYGIKIVSYQYDDPIENSFSRFGFN